MLTLNQKYPRRYGVKIISPDGISFAWYNRRKEALAAAIVFALRFPTFRLELIGW
jgi:hypothetical protein